MAYGAELGGAPTALARWKLLDLAELTSTSVKLTRQNHPKKLISGTSSLPVSNAPPGGKFRDAAHPNL